MSTNIYGHEIEDNRNFRNLPLAYIGTPVEQLTAYSNEMINQESWFNSEVIGDCNWCNDGITQATRLWHGQTVCRDCHIEAYLPENHNR